MGYALLPPAPFVLLALASVLPLAVVLVLVIHCAKSVDLVLVLWYSKFVNISISIAVLVAEDMTESRSYRDIGSK